jgi:hypothetical protein
MLCRNVFLPDSIRIEQRTKDNQSVVSLTVPLSHDEGDLQAKVDFGETKVFLGSSSNPNKDGFLNADNSILAVNHQPMTKSSYVYIWPRVTDGDLIFPNNVNRRVARLLKGHFSESANYVLRVEAIVGRKLSVQTVDFGGKGEHPTLRLWSQAKVNYR